MKNLFTILIVLTFLVTAYSQDTIHVPADYTTIQAAIDAANNGDIVLVAEDTYYENINFNGKAITVASHFLIDRDRGHIDNTIINGSQNFGPVVTFNSGEDTSSVIFGFTITEGHGVFADYAGGIYCENSGPKIVFNSIKSNYIGSGEHGSLGGGIYSVCDSDTSEYYIVIDNNIISNNTAYGHEGAGSGGGICLYRMKGRICNNLIIQNSCVGHGAEGGGMALRSCNLQIINNTIISNSSTIDSNYSSHDGGISVSGGESIIMNNIIWGNTGNEQISENASVYYCDVEGGYAGIGNIDLYPEFVDTANGDYHLSDGSPCISAAIDSLDIAGTWYYCPLTDLEGNPRPNPSGSMPDMGAYEFGLPVGVEENFSSFIPDTYSLELNFPNPFNPSTKITYSIPQYSNVIIKVFDILGNEIETLLNEEKSIGTYEITWIAENLPSGIYFYRLQAGSFIETKKMVLMK